MMLTAIAIVTVMYFAILQSRYRGKPFTPSLLERYFVLAVFLAAIGTYWILKIERFDYPHKSGLWISLGTCGLILYCLAIPVRLGLRFKILNIEWASIFAIGGSALIYALALP